MVPFLCPACGARYGLSREESGSVPTIDCKRCGSTRAAVPADPTAESAAEQKGRERVAAYEAALATYDDSAIVEFLGELGFHDLTRLGREEVEEFEQECGVTLPDDYRHFIQAIGDGAPGPDGGIAPLGYSNVGDRWEPLSDGELASLAEEFVGGEGTSPEDLAGALPLTWDGCGRSTWLVVTGPHRGQVWEMEVGDWQPVANPLLRPVSFREWYALWLHTRAGLPDGIAHG